jgi:hypothetical protein
MGKRLIQSITLTCMLYCVSAIGSLQAPKNSSPQPILSLSQESGLLFPALKTVFR